jgi:hypothetical protein
MVAHPASNSAQLRVWVYPFIAFGDGDGPIPARVNKGQLLASCYPYIYIVRRLIDIDAKLSNHAHACRIDQWRSARYDQLWPAP